MRIARFPKSSSVFARLAAFVNSRAMQIAKIKPDRLESERYQLAMKRRPPPRSHQSALRFRRLDKTGEQRMRVEGTAF